MSKLFHALVVLGAGVSATHCGGKTLDTATDGDASAGAGGSPGASSAAGGNRDVGHGGSLIIITGSAGQGGQGGQDIGEAVPPPDIELGDADVTGGGTFSQWTCPTRPDTCVEVKVSDDPSYMSAYLLSQPCPTDPGRPRIAADCAPDAWFTCSLAVWMLHPIAVNCECKPKTSDGCDYEGCFVLESPVAVTCTEHSKLCGCAYSGILR